MVLEKTLESPLRKHRRITTAEKLDMTSDPRATYFKIKFKSKNIKSKEKAALSRCCKEQYSIGTWNVGSMNQGKLEVAKQEMVRVNIDILGISKLKWTGMGERNSDDHYLYLLSIFPNMWSFPTSWLFCIKWPKY